MCCAAPNVALAQQTRQVEVSYDITFLGFTGFRIDFSGTFAGTRYDVQSHTFKEGVMRAMTIHYDGRNRAWGGFSPQGASPTAARCRSWSATSRGPGSRNMARAGWCRRQHNPDVEPSPDQDTIPEDKRLGSLDPLSAAMSVGSAGDAACDRTVPLQRRQAADRRHPEEDRHRAGATAGVPQAKSDLLVCEIYTKRIAGEFFDAPKEAETERERPMRIWLARLDDSPFRYPVKLEASTGFGTIRGRLMKFQAADDSGRESRDAALGFPRYPTGVGSLRCRWHKAFAQFFPHSHFFSRGRIDESRNCIARVGP